MRAHFYHRMVESAFLGLLLLGGCGPTGAATSPQSAAARRPVLPAQGGSPDADAVLVRDATFMMPLDERLREFRNWVSSRRSLLLTLEGLKQLAWAADAAGFDAAVGALERPEAEVIEQAAMAITEYGPPLSARASEALLAALNRAEPRSRPTLIWALVELGEPRSLDTALSLFLEGKLEQVRRLDGSPAFDLARLAALLPEAR